MNKKELGYFGERIACNYLKDNGFLILLRNFTIRGGEIDLIALDKKTLVFIEVKTRSSDYYGSVVEQLTARKKSRLRNASLIYLNTYPSFYSIRYDFITINIKNNTLKKIKHFKNVAV